MRWSLILAALGGLTAVAQQEYRLRVTVNLVQVDATVTDSKGDLVPDLKAGDFRVLLDGKPQELKYCNFVRSNDGAAPAPNQPASAPSDPLAAPAAQPAMPAGAIKRQDVRRTAAPVEADATKAAGAFARGSLEVPKGLDPGEYLVRVDVGPARSWPAGDKANPEAIGAWQWAKLIVR